ncbi:hypothetical protein UFOVP1106_41 [uncultured Caudovirales phage]|uniref:Uncharacterized protein n=1 Tax=uncultured Caudovirales phage TaxID=2100421 RepID=A0A6J5QMD3_9CAUD|nr:hypothetical protein UFOVP1106_41 [uncultured Caudovirales phage]
MQTITSKIYSLDKNDLLKGLLMAVVTPCLVIIQSSLDSGTLNLDWKNIGMAAVGGGVAYLLKNFFTPSQVITKQ